MIIAILVNHFPPKWLAGTEIATYNLAEHLAKRGHEIHIITSYDEGLPNFTKENGFYVHRIAWPKIKILGVIVFWLNVVFTVRKIKPDIVHVQSIGSGVPAYLIKKILKKPYTVWGRGSDVYLPGRFIRVTRNLVLQNADAILVLTEDMRKKMTEFTSRNIYIVPNGINLEQFNDRSQNLVKNGSTKNILFVGRLHPVKGVQYLIEAMEYVLKKVPNCNLILVGDGVDRARLETLSVQLGIKKSVHFVGIVPHEKVRIFMQQADIFVLPSLSEGFPGVILEAMACGLPIVATRVGGVVDIVNDGSNGYLVDVKDSKTVADRIILLLQDNEMRVKMSVNNRRMVEIYKWDEVTAILEKILLKCVNGNSLKSN